MKPICNVCKKPAEVKDTEYGEYYCEEHAKEYQVFEDGAYQWIGSDEN